MYCYDSRSVHAQHTHTHAHAQNSQWGAITCDFKPHINIWGLCGDDPHHVSHGVAFHHREGEGRLLEEQQSRVGRQLRLLDPLDVQAASGGFLRTSIVNGFDLRARRRTKKVSRGVTQHWASAQLSSGSSTCNPEGVDLDGKLAMVAF